MINSFERELSRAVEELREEREKSAQTINTLKEEVFFWHPVWFASYVSISLCKRDNWHVTMKYVTFHLVKIKWKKTIVSFTYVYLVLYRNKLNFFLWNFHGDGFGFFCCCEVKALGIDAVVKDLAIIFSCSLFEYKQFRIIWYPGISLICYLFNFKPFSRKCSAILFLLFWCHFEL